MGVFFTGVILDGHGRGCFSTIDFLVLDAYTQINPIQSRPPTGLPYVLCSDDGAQVRVAKK